MRVLTGVLSILVAVMWLGVGGLGLYGLSAVSTAPPGELPEALASSAATLKELSAWVVAASSLWLGLGLIALIAGALTWFSRFWWPPLTGGIALSFGSVLLMSSYFLRGGGPGRGLAGLSAVLAILSLAVFWYDRHAGGKVPQVAGTELFSGGRSTPLVEIRGVQSCKLGRGGYLVSAAVLFFMPAVTHAIFTDLYPWNRSLGGLTPVDYLSARLMVSEVALMIVLLCAAPFAGRPGVRVLLNKGDSFDIDAGNRLHRDALIATIRQELATRPVMPHNPPLQPTSGTETSS